MVDANMVTLAFAYKDSIDFREYVDSVARKRGMLVEDVMKLKIVQEYYIYLQDNGRIKADDDR